MENWSVMCCVRSLVGCFLGALFFIILSLNAQAKPAFKPLVLSENLGFCSKGVPSSVASHDTKLESQDAWGSFCKDGERTTGTAKTSPFFAPSTLTLYLAGYPSGSGLSLKVENLAVGETLTLAPSKSPAESWRLYSFPLPSSWRGQAVRIVAGDQSTIPSGWLAFSKPLDVRAPFFREGAALVLEKVALSLFLFLIPSLAVCSLAVRRGCHDRIVLGLIALAVMGLNGYLSLWLWFTSPLLGKICEISVPFIAAVYLFFSLRSLDRPGHAQLGSLWIPYGVTAAAALLVLSMGFLYGGVDDPTETAKVRFSHPLLGDNTLPFIFAENLEQGHVDKPMVHGWLSSDRPPLQTGIYLSQRIHAHDALGYLVVSVIAQCLWTFGLLLMLQALGVNRYAIGLVIMVCLLTGLIFLNCFYTWPKLLAAAYFFGLATLLLQDKFRLELRTNKLLAGLAGLLLALSMLSHGATIFSVLGFAVTLIVLRKLVSIRTLALVLAVSALLYLPWALYQKYFDPPGDRLLKWHLAGEVNLNSRPFGELFVNAYKSLTLRQWAANKEANLEMIVGPEVTYWRDTFQLLFSRARNDPDQDFKSAESLRTFSFFSLVPLLGILIIGPLTLVAGIYKPKRSPEWRTAAMLCLFSVSTVVIWSLLLFNPGTTVTHAGSYTVVLGIFASSVLALWALSPVLALIAGSFHISMNVLLYVVLMRAEGTSGYLRVSEFRYDFAALAVASLLLLLFVLTRLGASTSFSAAKRDRFSEPSRALN